MKSILILIGIIAFLGCSENKKPEAKTIAYSEALDTSTYSADAYNDSYELSDSCSYWYVYFSTKTHDGEWRGYKVIKLPKPYFQVAEAINIIYPQNTADDYVGIDFFKEVDERTYTEYKLTDN